MDEMTTLEDPAADRELAAVFATLPRYASDAEDEAGTRPQRGYIGWAPGDDSMDNAGTFDTWADFIASFDGLDVDLNLVADFYFDLTFDSADCVACDRRGWNPQSICVEDTLRGYPMPPLDDSDVAMLVTENRLAARDFGGSEPTADIVNRAVRMTAAEKGAAGWSWFGHDAINEYLLVKHRAENAGVFGTCDVCAGKAYVRTGPDRIVLRLWMLYPRKGRSVGLTINDVKPADLGAVKAYLAKSFTNHARHFTWATD